MGGVILFSVHLFNLRAYAITKDGEYIELIKGSGEPVAPQKNKDLNTGQFRDHNYAYYKKLYYGSKKRQGVGAFLTILGVGLEIGGYVIANGEFATDQDLITAGNLILVGSLMETVGIPLLIS